jgi:type IV secretion system T-DNA border endonuclease VirD1
MLESKDVILSSDLSAAETSNRYKVISLRLRYAEFETFCNQIQAFDLTPNLALRIAVRRIGGFLEVDANLQKRFEEALVTVGEISAAIRALHDIAIKSGEVDLESLSEQRLALGDQFACIDALLRSILNVSLRRSDGRQRLAGAMV